MPQITIEPQDLHPLHLFYFVASHEGKCENQTFNRMYVALDKEVKKVYGVAYKGHIETIRKQVEQQRKLAK